MNDTLYGGLDPQEFTPYMLNKSLYITRGTVCVRTFVTLGVASSVANDVTMRMTS